jgi:hypothetical protein
MHCPFSPGRVSPGAPAPSSPPWRVWHGALPLPLPQDALPGALSLLSLLESRAVLGNSAAGRNSPGLSSVRSEGRNLPAPHARCVEQNFMFLYLRVSSRTHTRQIGVRSPEVLSRYQWQYFTMRSVVLRSSAALRLWPSLYCQAFSRISIPRRIPHPPLVVMGTV